MPAGGKRYMTDAQISGLARELREKGIDCETVHQMMQGNEHSEVQIRDPAIIKFLLERHGEVTLITMDRELAEYCSVLGIPCVKVQDLVAHYIQKQ
jgi:rRNA-processing protein FCF1